jgi:hypothetical protein
MLAAPTPTASSGEQSLTAAQAWEIKHSKDESINNSLQTLLSMAERKIRTTAMMNESDMLWQVPPIQADLPPYDPQDVAKRIAKQLRSKPRSFYVKVLGSTLYVSWRYGRHTTAAASAAPRPTVAAKRQAPPPK